MDQSSKWRPWKHSWLYPTPAGRGGEKEPLLGSGIWGQQQTGWFSLGSKASQTSTEAAERSSSWDTVARRRYYSTGGGFRKWNNFTDRGMAAAMGHATERHPKETAKAPAEPALRATRSRTRGPQKEIKMKTDGVCGIVNKGTSRKTCPWEVTLANCST